jgi:hypothetical protein
MAKNQNLSPEQLKEALSLLKQLKKGYNDLGKEDPLKGVNAANLESFIQGAGGIKNILKQWTIELDTVDDQLESLGKSAKGIFTQFSNIVGELKKSNQNLNIGNKAIKSFQDIAEKVKNDQQGITDLNKKDLLTLIQKQKQSVSNLDIANKALKTQINRGELEGKELENAKNLIAEREKEATAISDLNKLLQERLEEEEKIESKTGLTGKLLEGFKKIPVLGDVLDIDGAKTAMRDAAKTGASGFSTLGTGVKALGPSLTAALGPLALISLAVTAFKALIDVMFEADKQVTDIAKNLNISKDSAANVRENFFKISDEAKILTNIQEGNLILQEDLVKTQLQFNQLLGASVDLSSEENKELAAQLTNANKFLKLNEEEFKGLIGLYAQTGETVDNIKLSILGTAKAYKLQTGYQLDERRILGDVLKTSNSIKLSIKGGTEALVQATINAQKFGTSLDQLDKTADSLLNFEQSISNELEAELLLGRDLNLERARAAALTNDQVSLTEEVGKLVAGFGPDFEKNRIAQEAFAKTLGISRNELADMYTTYQENEKLRNAQLKIGKEEIKQLVDKKIINGQQVKLIEAGKLSGVQFYDMLKKAGYEGEKLTKVLGGLSEQSLASQSAQEKFDDALKAAKETFTRFVDGESLDKFADFLTKFIESVRIKGLGRTIFGGLADDEDIAFAKIQEKEQKLKEIKGTTPEDEAERTKIKKELEDLKASFNTAQEKTANEKQSLRGSEANITMGGDRQLAVKDFVIKTLPEDTVVAAGGTNLGRTDEMVILFKELITAVKQGGNVYLDLQKVGSITDQGAYRLNS